MGGRRQPDGMSGANLQRFHPRRGAQKSVVAHKSLFYNKLATYRVDETITLKIAYYLTSNDLRATPKLNARLSPAGPAGSCRKGSPRPDEDNRLLSCLLMKPGIRITQDCADPCRGMSTQEPVGSKKCVEAWPRPAIRVVGATSSGHFVPPTW